MPPAVGPEVRDKLYRDRIEAMTVDNASLQRRLLQVQDDLTRVRREKDGIIMNLKSAELDNNRVHQSANLKDETDMSNQMMQEDLAKQRIANKQLEMTLQDQ